MSSEAEGTKSRETIAKHMNLEFYDKKILDEIAGELQVPAEGLKQYDEKPKKAFLSRTVKGHTNSPEELLAQLQFDFIRRKAEEGKSFVIVGRCAEDSAAGKRSADFHFRQWQAAAEDRADYGEISAERFGSGGEDASDGSDQKAVSQPVFRHQMGRFPVL